jgi:hypothetical protein
LIGVIKVHFFQEARDVITHTAQKLRQIGLFLIVRRIWRKPTEQARHEISVAGPFVTLLTACELQTLGPMLAKEHCSRRNVVDAHGGYMAPAVDAVRASFQYPSVRSFLSGAFTHACPFR